MSLETQFTMLPKLAPPPTTFDLGLARRLAVMRTTVVLSSRLLPSAAIAVVLVGQSWFAESSSSAELFVLWSNTLLLLAPAVGWLVPPKPIGSLVATSIMAGFLIFANLFGGAGYVIAFWVGLPVSALAGWFAARRETVASSHAERVP